MSPHEPRSLVFWRWMFLTLEAFVIVVMGIFLLAEFILNERIEPDLGIWTVALAVLFGLAWLFLMIVSPFFLRSLRGIALAGWLIGFGLFVLGTALPAKRHVKAHPGMVSGVRR